MTEYWIDVHECDRVLGELSDQIFDLLGDYSKAQEHLLDTRNHLCHVYECADTRDQAERLDDAITDFADERLLNHVDGVIKHVQASFAAMRDVMYHYTSGNAEMASRGNNGALEVHAELPELRRDGPPPEQSTIPSNGDDTHLRGSDTTTPFVESNDHRIVD